MLSWVDGRGVGHSLDGVELERARRRWLVARAQMKPANTSGYRRQRRKRGRHWWLRS